MQSVTENYTSRVKAPLEKWRGEYRVVTLSVAKGLRRKAAGFFAPFGRSE